MFNLSKKGVSNTISTVLLIMISIAAASLLLSFVMIIVDVESQLGPATSCLDAQTARAIEIKSACLDYESEEIQIVIQRVASESMIINALNFAVNTGPNTYVYACGSNMCGGCQILQSGQIRTYYLPFPEDDPAAVQIGVNSGCLLDEVTSLRACQ